MIKITRNGSRVIVESDSTSAEIDHYLILSEWNGVLPAMRVYDVDHLEAEDYADLQSAFDKIYKERTGKTQGYFIPTM
jgi:hypothetical protein